MPKGCDRERKGGWPGDSELRKRDQVEAGGTKKIIEENPECIRSRRSVTRKKSVMY